MIGSFCDDNTLSHLFTTDKYKYALFTKMDNNIPLFSKAKVLKDISPLKIMEKITSLKCIHYLNNNILLGSYEGIKLINPCTGKILMTYTGSSAKKLAVSPDQIHFASTAGDCLKIWNSEKENFIESYVIGESPDDIAYLSEEYIAYGSIGGIYPSLKILNLKTRKIREVRRGKEFSTQINVYKLLLLKDKKLAVGDHIGRIFIIDIEKDFEVIKTLHYTPPDYCDGYVKKIISLPDNLLASANGNNIRIWNLESGECITSLECALGENYVQDLEILDNKLLISVDNLGDLKVWDYLNKECLSTYPKSGENLTKFPGNFLINSIYQAHESESCYDLNIWNFNQYLLQDQVSEKNI